MQHGQARRGLAETKAVARAGVLHRQVVLPMATVLVLAAVCVAALMLFAASAQDEAARTASLETMREGLRTRAAQLGRVVKDYAYWTEAAEAVQRNKDRDWADERLGYYLNETHGYDWVFVIAPDDTSFYAAYKGAATDREASALLGHDLWRVMTSRARAQASAMPEPISAYVPLPDGYGIASVAAITPEAGYEGEPFRGPRYTLMVIRKLEPRLLSELSQAMGLTGMRFVGPTDDSPTSLPLTGPDGAIVGKIAWEPQRPGRAFLVYIAPSMGLALVLFAIFGVSAVRHSRHATDAIVESESRFRDVADASSDWIFETDPQGRITWISDRFTTLTGIATEQAIGQPLTRLLEPHPDEVDDFAEILAAERLFRMVPRICLDREGRRRFLRVSGKPVRDAAGRLVGWRGTGSDVTVEFEAMRTAEFLSRHDPLTGCLNRKGLTEALDSLIEAVAHRGERVAVLMFDIDSFSEINEELGAPAGDRLLQEIALRLDAAARPGDVVGRAGADEFVLIRPGVADAIEAQKLADSILRTVCERAWIDGQSVEFSCSTAVVIATDDADSAERALQVAGFVGNRAKLDGKGSIRTFKPDMDATLQKRRALERDLRRALEREELAVHYQPKLGLRQDALSGVEALVRWRHPQRGLVPPLEFIPVAEETGLIREIGAWVLQRACSDIARFDDVTVAVNLSPSQFRDPGLIETIERALHESGLPPARLELEITESVLLSEETRARECIAAFERLGVRLAMDDFGTGYSSMSYLTRVHFDKIKIDRAFVGALDRGGEAIIRAIIGMSRSLGIVTCAEGIETREQLEQLRSLGCDEIQGYYYAKPMPIDELAPRFLRRAVPRLVTMNAG